MQTNQKAPVYQRPVSGQAVTSIIQKDYKSPKLKVKFSNIFIPFYYPNSPTVARWSVSCLVDPEIDQEFVQNISAIEEAENVQGSQTFKDDVYKDRDGQIIKSGKFLMKFQTKDKIPVIVIKAGFPEVPADMKQEISFGDYAVVVFDIVKYTKKNVPFELNKGISYQPKMIYLYPSDEENNHAPQDPKSAFTE